jgi:hypothetical protein
VILLKRKKGQSAMEYLMTYGWAILIVIVVVAALYAMGVFQVAPSVKCSPCFGTSDFTYIDHSDTQLVVKAGPREIDIHAIGVDNGSAISVGETATVDISSCAWTTPECLVVVGYTVTESGIIHSSQATLHQG